MVSDDFASNDLADYFSSIGNLFKRVIVSVMFDLPVMHVIIVDTNCTSTVLECE